MLAYRKLVAALGLLLITPGLMFADDSIFRTAAGNGSFNTLVSLVVAAGLDDALDSDGEFTVFAPNDAAFAALGEDTLNNLRKPENREQLAAILKYHVVGQELSVPKRRPSHPLKSIKTLQGERIRFTRRGSNVSVNDSKIIARNIRCSNGLIHVIDGVLLPPEDNSIAAVAAKAGNFKTLLAAAEAAGLTGALTGDGPLTVFAPTDEAFAALPENTVRDLLKPENREQLAEILKYHVVSGRISATDAVKAGKAKTLAGQSVNIRIRAGRLTINDSNVIQNDVTADNGIIHIIDSVLMPETKETTTTQGAGNTSAERVVTIKATWNDHINRDGIDADVINITCSGGGSVKLTNVRARKINTRIGGGGTVTLAGTAETHEARVAGGARLNARDLVTSSTPISVAGGGNATINATDEMDVSASGGATVQYVSTDATIRKQINKYARFVEISRSH